MFTADDVQARIRQQPFVPLRIVTTTGQTYDIEHPELVMIARRYLYVGLPSKENPLHAEHVSQISLLHITEIQNLPSATASGNGHGAA